MTDTPKTDPAEIELTRVATVQLTPGPFRVPDSTVARHVTGFLDPVLFGGLIDLTLVCVGSYVQPDGSLQQQIEVTSRSRFDLDTARRLRDALDATIQGLTAPPPDQVN